MKNYKTIIIIVVVIVCGLLLLPRAAKKIENQLIVGMMSGWAPFMSINGAGEYEGFDVDVAQEIAQRMNKNLVVQDLGSLASCFVALEQQKIDMFMSDLDITEKRRDVFNMVRYTGNDVQAFDLMFWNNVPENVRSMEDLRKLPDAVICVESGSAQERFVDSFPFVTKKRLNSLVDIVLDLRFGKSLATVLEPRIAARLQKQNLELQRVSVALPAEFQVFGCGIAIKKNNVSLARDIAYVIQNMIQDGTIKKLEQKWQLEE
jgi:ABC-type amino acid transport substrate-binding protein